MWEDLPERHARRRDCLLRATLLSTSLTAVLAVSATSPAWAQDIPELDRETLDAVCEARAPDADALATCLDVVAEILAPDESQVPDGPSESADDEPLAFEPIKLKGRGSKVARFQKPVDTPAIAKLTHNGKSNFSVWSIGSDGSRNELLVNEIGRYRGSVLFDIGLGEDSVALDIDANGRWTADIIPSGRARVWDTSADLSGKGDDVVLLSPTTAGFAVSTLEHKGRSNFAVWVYTVDGDADLLVNEIGRYSGEALWPDGSALLSVGAAGGKWSVTAPE